ncbi:MAG: beta-propeller domain-containing protein [Pirellulaceae bacterium]
MSVDPSDRFPTFDSGREAYREFLIADAETRYQYLFGSYVWNRGDWWLDGDFAGGPAPEAGANDGRDSSDTNVQVEGVDEADLVEFDADYLYSLAGRELVIMSAWPGEDLAEVSRTLIAGNPVGQYLAEGDDRLTVISTVSEFIPDWEDDAWRRIQIPQAGLISLAISGGRIHPVNGDTPWCNRAGCARSQCADVGAANDAGRKLRGVSSCR